MGILHYARWQQSFWLERSQDRKLPVWQRVSFYAYGGHGQHGHRPVAPGVLEEAMGVADRKTGHIRPMNPSNLNREIKKAVKRGWLAPGSTRRCLIVPGHAVSGGGWGSPWGKCPHHKRTTSDEPSRSVINTAA